MDVLDILFSLSISILLIYHIDNNEKRLPMKKILLLLLFSLLPIIGCSFGRTVESYEKTPLKTEAKGQGKTTYNYTHKGKTYVLIQGTDGKFYAIDPETLGNKRREK